MEQWQRDAIRKNYVNLVCNIDQIDHVIDILYNENCLAESTKETLHAIVDTREQTRKLLEHIQKRPAFEKFVKILDLTENEHLVRKLVRGTPYEQMLNPLDVTAMEAIAQNSSDVRVLPKPPGQGHAGIGPELEKSPIEAGADGDSVPAEAETISHLSSQRDANKPRKYGKTHRNYIYKSLFDYYSDEEIDDPYAYIFPERWPERERIMRDIIVKPVENENIIDIFKEQSDRMHDSKNYLMTKIPRGRAVIISNDVFADGTWNRSGNQFDEDRLVILLKLLQFDVDVWKNKCQDDLLVLLEKEGSGRHSSYSSFMMFILTHGRQNKIMTAENDYMPFETILKYFDVSWSYKFSSKPKMFFIQACQGNERENSSVPPQRVADSNERFFDMDWTEADSTAMPKYSDMLVAVATVPGLVAWRNNLYGSWFIQAIIEIFSNCACYEDVVGMMTKVNKLVSKGTTEETFDSKEYVQICKVIRNTLRAKVYLFPGLVKEPKDVSRK